MENVGDGIEARLMCASDPPPLSADLPLLTRHEVNHNPNLQHLFSLLIIVIITIIFTTILILPDAR